MGLTPGIGYLGPRIDHCNNLHELLEANGLQLQPISDSTEWASGKAGSSPGKLAFRARRWRDQMYGTRDRRYLEYALRQIDEGGLRCVLAYWGTRPLADIKALKRRRPEVKFVLNLLCHPIGLSAIAVKLQNLALSGAMDWLDGLIVSSSVMGQYVQEHIRRAGTVPTLILPPYWSARYGPAADLPPVAGRPNVIFMGRMDWKSGQRSDNVTASLRELMREGIDVHFSRSAESGIEEPHAFPFDALPLSRLAEFAAPFDASLIHYNLEEVPVKDRFENTIPDRLITSVAARSVVALPAEGFSACAEYLRDYGAVLRYRSMPDLAGQLRDRERIAALRKLARQHQSGFTAEATFARLQTFLQQIQPALSG